MTFEFFKKHLKLGVFLLCTYEMQALDSKVVSSSTSHKVRTYGTYWLEDLIEIANNPEEHIRFFKDGSKNFVDYPLPVFDAMLIDFVKVSNHELENKKKSLLLSVKKTGSYEEGHYRELADYYKIHAEGKMYDSSIEKFYGTLSEIFNQYADLVKLYFETEGKSFEQQESLQGLHVLQKQREEIKEEI